MTRQGPKASRAGRGRTGTIIPAPTPEEPKQQTPEEIIRGAIGEQGTPATLKEAGERINPNYQVGVRNEWSTNCQRCVWAVEMQRRGYDVEAMPRTSDDDYAKADTSYAKSFLNVAKGGLELETVGSPFWKSSAADFKAHFTDKYEVGARGLIVCQSNRGGHTFNWEIIKGKNGPQVRFYDGQGWSRTDVNMANRPITDMQKRWYYFREARMDNVEITPLIADYVRHRS